MDRRRSERSDAAAEPDNKVPPALLEEVFALNEELDEVRELRAVGAPAERMERPPADAPANRSSASAPSTRPQLEELFAQMGRRRRSRR